GVAPANLQVTFDPRSTLTAVIRATSQANVILTSPEAINIEPTVSVNLNFRDVDQRGTIVAVNGTLVDILADANRSRVYIADSLNSQILVFDTARQGFLSPVEVGAQPKSMALVGNNLMAVATSAAETISVVDLDALQQVQQIPMGPVNPA